MRGGHRCTQRRSHPPLSSMHHRPTLSSRTLSPACSCSSPSCSTAAQAVCIACARSSTAALRMILDSTTYSLPGHISASEARSVTKLHLHAAPLPSSSRRRPVGRRRLRISSHLSGSRWCATMTTTTTSTRRGQSPAGTHTTTRRARARAQVRKDGPCGQHGVSSPRQESAGQRPQLGGARQRPAGSPSASSTRGRSCPRHARPSDQVRGSTRASPHPRRSAGAR